MSGGIGSSGDDTTQIVVFTVRGPVTADMATKWNMSIKVLKEAFPDNLHAVTMSSTETRETIIDRKFRKK